MCRPSFWYWSCRSDAANLTASRRYPPLPNPSDAACELPRLSASACKSSIGATAQVRIAILEACFGCGSLGYILPPSHLGAFGEPTGGASDGLLRTASACARIDGMPRRVLHSSVGCRSPRGESGALKPFYGLDSYRCCCCAGQPLLSAAKTVPVQASAARMVQRAWRGGQACFQKDVPGKPNLPPATAL